jgi:hypothetical protein
VVQLAADGAAAAADRTADAAVLGGLAAVIFVYATHHHVLDSFFTRVLKDIQGGANRGELLPGALPRSEPSSAPCAPSGPDDGHLSGRPKASDMEFAEAARFNGGAFRTSL